MNQTQSIAAIPQTIPPVPDLETQRAITYQMGREDAYAGQDYNPFSMGSLMAAAWREGHRSALCADCNGQAFDEGDASVGYTGGPCQTCNDTGLEPQSENERKPVAMAMANTCEEVA